MDVTDDEDAGALVAVMIFPFEVPAAPRAVVAHHHEWFVDKVSEGLRDAGVHVVGSTDNGADALGMVVAEQAGRSSWQAIRSR